MKLLLAHTEFHMTSICFTRVVRLEFSTRALKSKKKRRFFNSKSDAIWIEKATLFFFDYFGDASKCLRTCLIISTLRWQFLCLEFCEKYRPFQAFVAIVNTRKFATSMPRNH